LYPADVALGMRAGGRASPRVQEVCALSVLRAPAARWELAAELHGRGTAEAREWVRPYLQWLERRRDGPLDVIDSLQQLSDKLRQLDQDKHEVVKREIGYLDQHKDRMDYKEAKKLGQPCGSGAIESTCSQYQRRFKLTGQFWSLQGDEAFLALATLHRNERWHLLFPHDES
jgi:hypothetical protein